MAYLDPAAGGSSGIYVARLLSRLGIARQVAAKAVLVPGGSVADRVANGDAEIGIHQISEILPVPGVVLVGPLPPGIQNDTIYAGGIGVAARQPQAAQAFLRLLSSDVAAPVLSRTGMEPPPSGHVVRRR